MRLAGSKGGRARLWTRVRNLLARRRGGATAGHGVSLYRPPPILAEVIPFLNDLDQITEERPPVLLRLIGAWLVAAVVATILVACVMRVDLVVQASGHLAADAPPIVLQPMERGIVRSLSVKPGDVVSKGQVLATLDPTFSDADLAALTERRRALAAVVGRIEAELAGAAPPPPTDSEAALQTLLFRQRQEQFTAKLRALDEGIAHDEADLHAATGQAELLGRQLDLAREVEAIRSTLYAHQTGSKLLYLEAQTDTTRAARERDETLARAAGLLHGLAARRADRQAFVDQWRSDLFEELARTRGDLEHVTQDVAKATRLHELIAVVAPQDGVVLDVAQRSVGSVLREAEPLVTLVPSHAALIAELMINSGDVGDIRAGDEAAIKVDAFPYQRHGSLRGRLRSVSQRSFPRGGAGGVGGLDGMASPQAGAGGGAFHLAEITLTDTTLHGVPEGARLIPGMTVSGELKVGTRTLIAYFLAPITRGLDESFREP